MFNIRKLSIIHLSMLSAAVFLILIFILVVQDISYSYSDRSKAAGDVELVSMLDALEKVAHNHAVERGLTAGFLGGPTDDRKAKVDEQRRKADQSVAALRAELAKDWPESYQVPSKTKALLAHLEGKSTLRREVDQVIGRNAFAYYSKLNALAIDAAQSLALNISNSDVSNVLNTALMLAKVKERLGQIRGKVNGSLARQAASDAFKTEVNGYVQDKNTLVEGLNNLLSSEQRRNFNQAMESPNAAKISSALTILLGDNTDFSLLPGTQDWFPMATAQIGDVKQILDSQWSIISASAEELKSDATSMFIITIVETIIGLILVVFLNYTLVRSVQTQLDSLTDKLDKIADEGDLTIQVATGERNELGKISRSINKTISALKDLIVGLDSSIGAGTRLSNELDKTTSQILDDSQHAQQMAINIGTAIEEMSQTSQQIAEATVTNLDASKMLDNSADESLAINQNTKDSITGLNQMMETVQEQASTMEKQVTDIGSILDTINTLSEQTNLLALNAAIEAARAGEHGRGFAVVADEVRTLAQGSRDSSDQISALLQELQKVSFQVVEGINQNAQSVQEVLELSVKAEETSLKVKDHAKRVEEVSTTVSASVEEQSVTFKQVAQDVDNVLKAAEHEFKLAGELRALFENAEINNRTLQRTMDNFKIE